MEGNNIVLVEVVIFELKHDLVFVDRRALLLGDQKTLPWGEGIEEANQRKLEYYEELVAEVWENGYVFEVMRFKVGVCLCHFLE